MPNNPDDSAGEPTFFHCAFEDFQEIGEPDTRSASLEAGRRIYVHQESLMHLARSSTDAAGTVLAALLSMSVVKVTHHMLSDAIALGHMKVELAKSLVRTVGQAWTDEMSASFMRVGYRPAIPAYRHGFYALILRDESIAATCFESDYFTFATSAAAARRMYEDTAPLRKLRGEVNSGMGPSDLTMIAGPALALIDSRFGIGNNKASFYIDTIRRHPVVSSTELRELKQSLAEDILQKLRLQMESEPSDLTARERSVIDRVLAACARIPNSGVFRSV